MHVQVLTLDFQVSCCSKGMRHKKGFVIVVVVVDACRCRWAYYVLCESTNYSAIYELYEL